MALEQGLHGCREGARPSVLPILQVALTLRALQIKLLRPGLLPELAIGASARVETAVHYSRQK